MKLATLKDSTRDGRLVVVSRDLTRCSDVGHIARTLQAALDDWEHAGPRLARVAEGIETGSQPTMRFHEHDAASPLPRAYQRIDAVAPSDDAGPMRKPVTDPLVYQGRSDSFLGPRDRIPLIDVTSGLDAGGEVAAILGDVPLGASIEEARAAIALIMLVNDVRLRRLAPGYPGSFGRGLFSAFSPVAVSTDELGEAWAGGGLHLPPRVGLNGKPCGAGSGVTFDFGRIIAHAARTRQLPAGTIVCSGIAETRMIATSEFGAPRTELLKPGDIVRIEMKDKAGHSIFGAIEQRVEANSRDQATTMS